MADSAPEFPVLTVDILGYKFTILPEPRLEVGGLLGACATHVRQILYRPDLYGRQLADTTLHEVIHAINVISLPAEMQLSEPQVSTVATALIDVLCRNPGLTQFLLEHGTGDNSPVPDPA